MIKETYRPAWVEIDLKNLDFNIKNIIKKVGPDRQIIGVVKANAYGHGAIECAKILRDNNCKIFAVATIAEAIELREAGFKDEQIICLGLCDEESIEDIINFNVTVSCCSRAFALKLAKAASLKNIVANIIISLDTGMGRIGYNAKDFAAAEEELRDLYLFSSLKICGIFSHLSCADTDDEDYTRQQIIDWESFLEFFKSKDAPYPMPFELQSLSNSAAIIKSVKTHEDAVRPGIILYGCYPSEDTSSTDLKLKPVMSVKAKIMQTKEIRAGDSVGYGRKFIAKKPTKIATINLGYADGLPRTYSGKAKVIVGGVLCPVAGKICMDQCMVDISNAPDAKIGDEVIIMGSDGKNSITAEDIAAATNTINYEILCDFSQRLPKKYIR